MVEALPQFSAAERESIHTATERARKSTSAKFELVVVPASDHYALFPIVWSALISLAITGVLALTRPGLGIGAGFIVNAALFVALTLVLDWWPIRLLVVPQSVKRLAASHFAHRAFAVGLVARDGEHNGVMVFASLGERYLEIIAERDAHARIPETTWSRIVTKATAAMRSGSVAKGLVQAIEDCGRELGVAFPKSPA